MKEFLAFDVGAESGRAIRGSLNAGVLTLTEVCRFANGPVRDNGSLRWDIHRVWHEMRRALEQPGAVRLESIGVDAWGCDYGLVRENGSLVERPFTYRDPRTDGVMEEVFAKVPRERIYGDDRYSVSLVQHTVPAVCGMSTDTRCHCGGPSPCDDPGCAELLAIGSATSRVHQLHHNTVHQRGDAPMGDGSSGGPRHPGAAAARARRARHDPGRAPIRRKCRRARARRLFCRHATTRHRRLPR